MSDRVNDFSLAEALRKAEELRDQLVEAQSDRLYDAKRRAHLYAEELLHCAVAIASLEGNGPSSEIDIALDVVRTRAEEVGLLRRQPPRPVP